MNTHGINTTAIGSGGFGFRSFASASQVLALAAQLTLNLRKYGASTQALTGAGALHVLRHTYATLTGELAVGTTALGRALKKAYATVAQALTVGASARVTQQVAVAPSGTLAVSAAVAAQVQHRVFSSASQALQLVTTGAGEDFYTGAAPVERVTPAVDLRTQAAPTVVIGS